MEKENTNNTNSSKKELSTIDEVISYVREDNNKQKTENEIYKLVLEFLRSVHLDSLDIEKIDDSLKEKIIDLVDYLKENRELKEEHKKNEEDINTYINNLEKNSHYIESKMKIKTKK